MIEIRSIIQAYASVREQPAALVTVVRVEGSSYRRMGARMLVLNDGTYLGGISGGCLEGDALRKAQKAILHDRPSIVTYDTTQDDEHQVGVGLGCNGIIDVLFTPLHAGDPDNPVRLLSQLADTRTPQVLVTITRATEQPDALARTIHYRNDEQFLNAFPIGHAQAVLDALHDCRSSQALSFEDGNSVLIEYLMPELHLLLFGGNYDVQPLARLAATLGWRVTIITSLAKAQKALWRDAQVIDRAAWQQLTIDAYTAIVLMNHDYKTDLEQLASVAASDAFYIGMLGPRKRSQKIFDELEACGRSIDEAARTRIFAPAGLDIGALTPESIGLSIVAEIQGQLAGRQGTSLRLREGAIHE